MSKLWVAMLGCGFATRLHSRTLRSFPDVERYYVSRSIDRATEYAKRYAGAGAFGSYREAIEDPRVDVALITTPPASHLELTRLALAAGKHVIVEKPPFLQSEDFAEVEELAAEAGKRVFVAENYFYKPLLRELRAQIEQGSIGDVRIITINALKRQKTEGDWRDRAEDAGGGAFFEGGIHWVNFMANLGLEVVDIHGYRPGGQDGLDRTMVAVFEYGQGAVGTLFYSWEIGSPMKGLRLSAIHGTDGAITFESNGLFVAVRGVKKRVTIPTPSDLLGYSAMFEDFFDSIRTGREAQFTFAAARRDLAMVERIYDTAAR